MNKKTKTEMASTFFRGFLNGLVFSVIITFITLLVLWFLL